MNRSMLRTLIGEAQQLAVPMQCVNCGTWGSWICLRCRTQTYSQVSDRNLRLDGHSPGLLQVTSALPYEGVGKRVILAHKERGLRSLAEVLASWLAQALQSAGASSGRIWLVPVPSKAVSMRRRGFDSLLPVSQQTAANLGSRVEVMQLLEWRSRVRPQKRLSRLDRAHNVANRVVVSNRRSGECLRNASAEVAVVLIDDVITTGNTLAECHRALGIAGVSCSRAATICAVIQ